MFNTLRPLVLTLAGVRRGGTVALILAVSALLPEVALTASLDSAVLKKIQAATFEVVMKKPETDSLSYERPLPLDLLSYSERTDKYISIGTAFAIGDNHYVTAAHVLSEGFQTQYGEPALRSTDGVVHQIDKVLQYSGAQDFVVLSLKNKLQIQPLETNREPAMNETVFAVGNALGEGIVIRDGLFTSQTPEDRHGEWKWIRFSAAASPGNSGGPLLDDKGHVIGVVLRKSQNENLNFAAPISLVLDAPANVGKVRYEIRYAVPVMNVWESGENAHDFSLPLAYADLAKEMIKDSNTFLVKLKEQLLSKQADTLFPAGTGSKALLSRVVQVNGLGLVYRKEDGVWDVFLPQDVRTSQLESNGYIAAGSMLNTTFAKFRRPDTVTVDTFYNDSKQYLDSYLKAVGWKRRVGREDVAITSFGKARREWTMVDAYGRKWQMRSWNVEYEDNVFISASLPVPDGYLSILSYPSTAGVEESLRDIETMTSFSYPQYTGTLKQWQEYLTRKDLLPAALGSFKLESEPGSSLKFAARRFQLNVPNELQKIGTDSILTLTTSYLQDGGKVVWDVTGVGLIENLSGSQALVLIRASKPDTSLPQEYTVDWQKIVNRTYPYNATVADLSGSSFIGTPYPYPASASPPEQVAYVLTVMKQGKQTQADMDTILTGFANALAVSEK